MKCVLIVTGGYIDYEWGKEYINNNEIVFTIAADKGLEAVEELGVIPDYVLGDYDSVNPMLLDKYKKDTRVKAYPSEKDYTDTHLALKYAIAYIKNKCADKKINICVLGATGSRLDHTMTNVYILNEAIDNGIDAYIADKNNKIYIKTASFCIDREEQYGRYVSFVPLTENVVISLEGMKYGLDRYELKQGESICQSNEVKLEKAFVTIHSGKVVVFESMD